MEFIRFGSIIPPVYWGCCAICVVQDFQQNPDAPYAIQLVSGDTGFALTKRGADGKKEQAWVGMTYREVFETRIRIGTHSGTDMPNHIFLASLTASQVTGKYGNAWLKILRENGFEFIRTTDNSVYTGSDLDNVGRPPNPVYLFGLFRNISGSRVTNPFEPPAAWKNLSDPYAAIFTPEKILEEQGVNIAAGMTEVQKAFWLAGETKVRTESEVIAAGVPMWMAGVAPPNLKMGTQDQKNRASVPRLRGKDEPKPDTPNPFGPAETEEIWDEDSPCPCGYEDCDNPTCCGTPGCDYCHPE